MERSSLCDLERVPCAVFAWGLGSASLGEGGGGNVFPQSASTGDRVCSQMDIPDPGKSEKGLKLAIQVSLSAFGVFAVNGEMVLEGQKVEVLG